MFHCMEKNNVRRSSARQGGSIPKKVFYLEWDVEGSKKENVIIITEMSGNTIKAGFVYKGSALWVARSL